MTNLEYIQSCTKEELVDLLCVGKVDCSDCVAGKYCRPGHAGFIDWLDEERAGDAFSSLTASIIRVMLNEWKKEQEGEPNE